MTVENGGEDDRHRRPAKQRLCGWKEIGAFFGKTERTVKRWEQRGMPIHRLPSGAKSAVFAYADELDSWLTASRIALSSEAEDVPALHESPDAANSDVAGSMPERRPAARRPRYRSLAVGFAGFAIVATVIAIAGGHLSGTGGGATVLAEKKPVTSRHQPAPEASALYQSGLYHWNTRTAEGLTQSRDEFQQAIAIDPNYPAAYAGLANAYNLLAQYDVMKPGEAYPLARTAAQKAILLDPDLATAHCALGFAMFYGYKDLPGAEEQFRRALDLDGNSSLMYHWYALMMMHTGKFDEPLRAITRAQELEPQSHAIRANRGLILFYAGKADEAIAVLQDLTRSAPNFLSPHYYLASIYLDQQRYDDYLRESLYAARLEGNAALQAAIEAAESGYRTDGAKGLFVAMLAVQQSELTAGRETAFNVARTAALLGDNETALKLLRNSLAAGESDIMGIRVDRAFKSLRNDPRFEAIASNVLDLTASPGQ